MLSPNLSRRKVLLVALAASALLLVVSAAFSAGLRLKIAEIFEPVTNTVRSIGRGVRSRVAAFGRGPQLQQELEAERQDHARTRAQLAEAQAELGRERRATAETAELRRALERTGWRRGVPVAANVIRRPGRWENCELTVDCGREQGVEPRQAVLVGESVLGVVANVESGTARVLTLGHPEVIIRAMIVETRQQGLVEAVDGRLELRYITRDQQVRPGHQIVTSDVEGAFPPHCLIGRVSVAVHAQDQPFYKIIVDPTRATASPETVWIITGTKPEEKPGGKRPGETTPSGSSSGSPPGRKKPG
jgi:cell shape-determining protein MreC